MGGALSCIARFVPFLFWVVFVFGVLLCLFLSCLACGQAVLPLLPLGVLPCSLAFWLIIWIVQKKKKNL